MVLALLCGAAVHARADTASRLHSAQGRLATLENEVHAKTRAVQAIQSQLDAVAERLASVQSRIDLTRGRILAVRRQIAAVSARIAARQRQVDLRARSAYEAGPLSAVALLLESDSLGQFETRLTVVGAASTVDANLIAELATLRSGLSARQASLRLLEQQDRATRTQLARQQAELDARFAAQRRTLAQLGRLRSAAEALVSKLKTRAARERARAQLGGSTGGGGAYAGVFRVCPVARPRAYADDFGAPRTTTTPPHPHAGNDIFAPLGTPIRAPFAGTAEAAPSPLGGIGVAVYGPLGYVYNAHLSRLGALGQVSAGTIVGYVGNTGDARGGPTHDHFEWHPYAIPAHPWRSPYGYAVVGGAVDPYPYLNAVC